MSEVINTEELTHVNLALEFAEWMDVRCVRCGMHEWQHKADRFTNVYTTREMWEIFLNPETK